MIPTHTPDPLDAVRAAAREALWAEHRLTQTMVEASDAGRSAAQIARVTDTSIRSTEHRIRVARRVRAEAEALEDNKPEA